MFNIYLNRYFGYGLYSLLLVIFSSNLWAMKRACQGESTEDFFAPRLKPHVALKISIKLPPFDESKRIQKITPLISDFDEAESINQKQSKGLEYIITRNEILEVQDKEDPLTNVAIVDRLSSIMIRFNDGSRAVYNVESLFQLLRPYMALDENNNFLPSLVPAMEGFKEKYFKDFEWVRLYIYYKASLNLDPEENFVKELFRRHLASKDMDTNEAIVLARMFNFHYTDKIFHYCDEQYRSLSGEYAKKAKAEQEAILKTKPIGSWWLRGSYTMEDCIKHGVTVRGLSIHVNGSEANETKIYRACITHVFGEGWYLISEDCEDRKSYSFPDWGKEFKGYPTFLHVLIAIQESQQEFNLCGYIK